MTQNIQLRNRVLVVEDNTDIGILIRDFLDSKGSFQTDHVEDAAAALERCRRQPYDLFIVDHLIPGMDGIQLLAEMRQSHGNIPAIMISGNPAVADLIETKETSFLFKPFSLSALLEESTRILQTAN